MDAKKITVEESKNFSPRGPSRNARGHFHAEAFSKMKYRTDDGSESEVLWNSRDGVTPFIISTADGKKKMSHVDWRSDVYAPNHTPVPGERVFVTATLDLIRERLNQHIEELWNAPNYPASKHFASKEEMFEVLAKDWTRDGSPWIVTVPEDGWEVWKAEHIA